MDSVSRRRVDALQQVVMWAEDEPQLFRAGSRAAAALRRIHAAIKAVEQAWVNERTAVTAEFDGRRPAIRRRFRSALRTLCRATQALDAEAPGLSTVYARPPYQSDRGLIEFADRMLTELEPVRERLLAALDLPSDYFTTVRQLMDRMSRAGSIQADARRAHVEARRLVLEALASGFAAVKVIDGIVRHHYADKESKLAHWSDSRRIPKSKHRRRRKKPAQP